MNFFSRICKVYSYILSVNLLFHPYDFFDQSQGRRGCGLIIISLKYDELFRLS